MDGGAGWSSGRNPEGAREARWWKHEDAERVTLQIELGNDCAVTLVCWKNGDAPSVGLWQGSGEHSFVRAEHDPGEAPESFREWIAKAGG